MKVAQPLRILAAAVLSLSPLLARAQAAADPANLSEMDSLWTRRDEPEAMKALEWKVQEALNAHPTDFEVLWRAARTRGWVADNAADLKVKGSLGKQAFDLGRKAAETQPSRPEGYYYAGTGVGAYASGLGVVGAITQGLEGKFLDNMNRAAALDPNFDRGGPLLAMGRYYAMVPWPKQDLKKAETFYNRVLAAFPENLRAQHYLAQLKVRQNDRPGARALMAKVRTAPVDYDPAEGKRVKVWDARSEKELGDK